MGHQKIIARPAAPPLSATIDVARATTRLPTEMLSEQIRRLVVFSTVGLVLWTIALILDGIILPSFWAGWERNWRAIIIELFGSIGSAAMCYYMRRPQAEAEDKNNVGLAMMLMHAVAIAVFNAWAYPPMGRELMRISFIALLILIYAMIAPSSPKKMLAASLAAATFDPLAYTVVSMLGGPALDPIYLLVICWPSYACAFIAIVPARVQQRFSRTLREAQDLGSYHLVERLGSGGMGEVWRAQHRLLARNAG